MAVLNCGKGSDILVSNNTSNPLSFTFDGTDITLSGYGKSNLYCYGAHTVTAAVGVGYISSSRTGDYDIGSSLNFIAGLLIAFLVGRLILLLFGR